MQVNSVVRANMGEKTNSNLVDISAIKNYAADVHKYVFWFKHYTEHGIKHSERVINILNVWMKKAEISLNALEDSILTAAIYLHDIGMQCTDCKIIKKIENCPFTEEQIESFIKHCGSGQCDASTQNYIRNNHANLTKLMIEDQCRKIIPNKSIRDVIAVICNEHTKEMISGDLHKNYQYQGQEVNIKKLAYLLRFGDCFDATRERLPKNASYLSPRMLPEHELHMIKHYVVKKISVEKQVVIDCRIPRKWLNQGDDKFRTSLREIVIYPIRNNMEKTQTPSNMWETNVSPIIDVIVDLKTENGQPWELGVETIREVNDEAFRIKSHNSDIVRLLSIAKKTLYIFGQNLHTLVDAKRDIGKEDKNYFKNAIFEKLRNDRSFKVFILILDPDKNNEVTFWHERLIKSNPNERPDFRSDLIKAKKIFSEWQAKASVESLNLEIRAGDLILESANVVDGEYETGMIIYSTTVQDAICNPLGRRYEISHFGDIDYSRRKINYETIYARAKKN